MSINLDSLSITQLKELQDQAAAMVEQKQENKIHQAREQVRQIAADLSMSVEELMGLKKTAGKSKGTGQKVAAKYRNPNNSAETWTGRGRTPRWLKAELDKGRSLKDFEI